MAEMARFDSAGDSAQSTASDHYTSIAARLPQHTTRSDIIKEPPVERNPAFEVRFEDGDVRDPRFWSLGYRSFVIFTMSYSTTAVVLYSTAYTASIPGVIDYFGVSRLMATLGLSVYLFGMAIGSVVSAPFSEMCGRKPVYLISMVMFLITVIPTGVTTSFAGVLAPRFFSGFAAAALVTNSPGSVNDIVMPKYRALAFSFWSIGPINGPVL
jgi:MFS family permease